MAIINDNIEVEDHFKTRNKKQNASSNIECKC